jgi:hypothetical protein
MSVNGATSCKCLRVCRQPSDKWLRVLTAFANRASCQRVVFNYFPEMLPALWRTWQRYWTTSLDIILIGCPINEEEATFSHHFWKTKKPKHKPKKQLIVWKTSRGSSPPYALSIYFQPSQNREIVSLKVHAELYIQQFWPRTEPCIYRKCKNPGILESLPVSRGGIHKLFIYAETFLRNFFANQTYSNRQKNKCSKWRLYHCPRLKICK